MSAAVWTTSGPARAWGRITLAHGLLISLLLHAGMVLPWVLGALQTSPPPRAPLAVELFGMVSNRQVEQKELASESKPEPLPPPKPAAEPVLQPKARAVARAARVSLAEPSPVQVAAPVKESPPAEELPVAPPSKAEAQPSKSRDDANQLQQTTRVQESEVDAIRRYLAGLRKAIQSRTVYPPEVRQKDYTGESAIAFRITDDGGIQPGSLKVRRSSGHAVLDESAMQAALASVPLARPPRQMEVVLVISFFRDD